jgi:murein DD-endopeptidase MepM/ murein hydrolase activator NlpD
VRRALLLLVLAGCGASPRVSRLTFPLPDATGCSRGFGARHALDVPAAEGTPILASAEGVVVRAAGHPSYGLAVILLHGDLPRLTYTLYAHLSRLAVTAGDRVAGGDVIGAVGHTGGASAPHLHFEVLEAAEPLPLRASGPIGVGGDEHRVDPGGVVDVPLGCRPTAIR